MYNICDTVNARAATDKKRMSVDARDFAVLKQQNLVGVDD